jgi:hypothetical protein
MRISGLFFTLLFLPLPAQSQVIMNEVMAANATTLMETDYYNFPDWVEVYNGGTANVNLSDYYLSDDYNSLKKWQFPFTVITAGQYYVVYCDKEGTGRHATFGLNADGAALYLSNKDAQVIDYLEYGQQYPDISFGRNQNKWLYCSTPTPGSANQTTLATERSPVPGFSLPAGRLALASNLTISGSNIKYTTDGAEPASGSTDYRRPITINTTTVVKTKSFQDGSLPGETYANTYFLSEHKFTLPVVSLSVNSDYFYDNTYGIHVTGTNGISQIGNCRDRANFNQDWERAVYMEYFDETGVKKISQPVGVKIAGGCTRFFPQKTFAVFAREQYGKNDLEYPFFQQKPEITRFKSILLRNSGNDFNASHLRDAFLQTLVNRSIDLDYQAYQPAIVYLNGQYWGIMNIREKVDEDYFLHNYNLSNDSIDFVQGNLMSDPGYHYSAIRGSMTEFTDLIAFVTSNSLTGSANYNYVVSRLDYQEYLNYMAFQIYIANTDWPGNNLKFWKRSQDGKWRWIVFDTDFGFGATESNHQTIHFAAATDGGNWPNPPWSTLLFRKLLENQSFRKDFARTMLTLRNTCFQPDWCNYVMDSLSARIDFEMTYHKAKYGGTKNDWYNELNRLKQFGANRYNFIPGYISSYFGLNGEQVIVSVANPNGSHGDVAVNTSVIENYPFSMKTYRDLDLSLEALPAKGFNFKHWEYSGQSIVHYIIPLGSEWSYLDEATGYPANWVTNSFDDTAWKKGPGQLGYGEGDEATVISFGPDPNNKIPTALFRKKFTLADTTGMSEIELELQMDDGAIVYLNGKEIFRSNMPEGTVSFTTNSVEANDQVVVYTEIARDSLVLGENVIACEVHQYNGTSSDLGFDISISYTTVEESSGGVYSQQALIQSDTSFTISLEPVFEPIDAIQGVYLNEIAPVTEYFRDEYDEESGFLELYNNTGEDIALFSFFLSDDAGNLMRYAIPDSTILTSHGFLVFYLDGEAKQGPLHTSFKADTDGESIYLSQKVGENITILDSASFSLLVANYSFGKYADGTGDWQHMVKMTPGQPNDPGRLEYLHESSRFASDIRVYPNPSDGNLFVSVNENNPYAQNYSIDVIDISGKVLHPKVWLNSSKNYINLTHLNSGLYFIRVFIDNRLINTGKVIIMK